MKVSLGFFGPQGSGKTRLMQRVRAALAREGFEVATEAGGARIGDTFDVINPVERMNALDAQQNSRVDVAAPLPVRMQFAAGDVVRPSWHKGPGSEITAVHRKNDPHYDFAVLRDIIPQDGGTGSNIFRLSELVLVKTVDAAPSVGNPHSDPIARAAWDHFDSTTLGKKD